MLKLIPFTKNSNTDSLAVEATAKRLSESEVVIEFHLSGQLELIKLPNQNYVCTRKDELWKHTCFEAFACENLDESSSYYEVNCAPQGDWNAYSFTSYREGMKSSEDLVAHLGHRESNPDKALFTIELKGSALKTSRHFGITAVIEFTDDTKAYYALAHTAPQADFHRKESFIISL